MREQTINGFLQECFGVCVVDAQTDRIVHANHRLEELWGQGLCGRRCYEVLSGGEQPCTFCPYRMGEGGGAAPYSWEYYDQVRRRCYQMFGRRVQENGRDYWVSAVIDATEMMKLSRASTRYLALIEGISQMQLALVGRSGLAFEQVLPIFTRIFRVRAAAFFGFSGGGWRMYLYREGQTGIEHDNLGAPSGDRQAYVRALVAARCAGAGITEDEVLCYPVNACGEPFGVFAVVPPRGGSVDDMEIAVRVLHVYAENAVISARMEWESSHDRMTGLLSRNQYDLHARGLYQTEPAVSVVSADLDRLKQINDQYGHSAGDAAIRQAAGALTDAAEDSPDIRLYRMGGDEFAAVLTGQAAAQAEAFCARVRAALEARRADTQGPAAELSLGVSGPASGARLDELYKQADREMYEEKARRRVGRAD